MNKLTVCSYDYLYKPPWLENEGAAEILLKDRGGIIRMIQCLHHFGINTNPEKHGLFGSGSMLRSFVGFVFS